MSTTCYQIDCLARTLLIEVPKYRTKLDLPDADCADPSFLEELRDRVMNLDFDCLPNWGFDGLRDPNDRKKQNWFFYDPQLADKAMLRYHCLDYVRLREIISSALWDFLGIQPRILGISVYGSYLYGHFDDFDDIDVIVIVGSSTDVALDAIRYRDRRLRQVFRTPCQLKFDSNELGLTIIGQSTLNRKNQSFIVAEAALLDTTITLSSGWCINAPPLTPFLMVLNSKKLVKWALSELLKDPIKTINLIDQTMRLRTMMLLQFPNIRFQSHSTVQFAWLNLMKQAANMSYILERCDELMKLLLNDESIIRSTVRASL